MRRVGLALALAILAILSGCAGIATYHVEPVYIAQLNQLVCCAATITSGKDVSNVAVDVVKSGADYQIHFTETGVGATAPIAAQASAVSSAADALGDIAVDVGKFSLKP